MKEFFFLMLCGPDNKTPDLARVLFLGTWLIWAVACFVFLFFSHDPVEIAGSFLNLFAVGSGLLISGATAILLKHKTEPAPGSPTP